MIFEKLKKPGYLFLQINSSYILMWAGIICDSAQDV